MIHIERRQHGQVDIGIAPLVDCVFLLLIFFLLTSTFSRERAIAIERPSSATAVPHEPNVIRIAISAVGEITLEGKKLSSGQLTEALAAVVERRGKLPVVLVADRRVPLQTAIDVIDCARGANLETVRIAARTGEAATDGSQAECLHE